MKPNPAVSVIIPAYNSELTIVRCLDSVLAQTRMPQEIIVVNDHSTDSTDQVIQAYPSSLIKCVTTAARSGAGGARNTGINAASGDLIAFLDADDEWLPKKLEKQIAMIQQDPRLSFVACGATSISPAGDELGDTYGKHRIAAGTEAWKALLASNFIATPSVLAWKRDLLRLHGFNEKMKIGEDQDLWIRLALGGSLGYVPEPLVRVHLRSDSLSQWVLNNLMTYTLPMIERHLTEQRSRLSDSEINDILGERLNRFGRVAYVRGDFASGARLICHSMLLGYQPLESVLYLLRASPPVTWIKRQFELGNGR